MEKQSILDVTVIIVTLNGKELLANCLKSFYKHERVKQVIVVDNGSTDGSVAWLKAKYPKIEVIKNKDNKGFAEANNQGLEIATGKYILYLNNDTIITMPFLKKLVSEVSQPSIAATQPMILFPNNTIDSIGSYMTPTGFLYHKAHRHHPKKGLLSKTQAYSLKGACMLWKKDVLDQIGNLDQRYFAYFEETDLCHRAINCGYQLLVVPSVSITHLGGMTSNKLNSEFVQYHSYKNRVATYIKHLKFSELIYILPIHLFLCCAIILLTFLQKPKLALAIIKGLLQGLNMGLNSRKPTSKVSIKPLTKNPGAEYYYYLTMGLENYEKIH